MILFPMGISLLRLTGMKLKLIHHNDVFSPFYAIAEKSLLHVIGDLFGAGSETTVTTLRWGLLFLLYNPSVQDKVQAEIDNVLGPEQCISSSYSTKMPYTMATIAEIQRLGDIVPFSVPHQNVEEAELDGYTIPAGTTILINLHNVHYDSRYWDKPRDFNPQRFLDSNGQFRKREELIPFSMGKYINFICRSG